MLTFLLTSYWRGCAEDMYVVHIMCHQRSVWSDKHGDWLQVVGITLEDCKQLVCNGTERLQGKRQNFTSNSVN